MLQRMHQPTDAAAGNHDIGVDAADFIPRALAAKQAHQTRGIPARVANRMTEKIIVAPQRIAIAQRFGGHQPMNFVRQCGVTRSSASTTSTQSCRACGITQFLKLALLT